MDPLWLALLAFAVVIVGVLWVRLPPFLALVLAAFLVAWGTPEEQLGDTAVREAARRVSAVENNSFAGEKASFVAGQYQLYRRVNSRLQDLGQGTAVWDDASERIAFQGIALQQGDLLLHEMHLGDVRTARAAAIGSRVAYGFGETCRKIGLLIALAAVIGCCLLESGAALRIVDAARNACGEERAPLAFAASGFFVGIPVFFDTVFYLLMPLAKAMRIKTGKNYLLYVMSIVVGASMAHSLVPPTPGPLLVAAKIDGVEVIDMMVGGFIVGIFAVASGYLYAVWANRRWEIPLRDTAGSEPATTPTAVTSAPPLWLSVLPIALPVVLLSSATVARSLGLPTGGRLTTLGDKNVALLVAAIVALAVLIWKKRQQQDDSWPQAVQASLTSGGIILLITAAGGAFGHVLRQSGVAEAIQERFPATRHDLAILVLAFVVTVLVRFVQGSATVAMITSVSIVAPLAAEIALSYHPVYLALAIGCGSKPLPWMNDSGFWIVGRMSGMTEAETLRTFSVTLTIMGVVGFLVSFAGAVCLPLAP